MTGEKYELSFTACSLHVNEMIQFLKVSKGMVSAEEGGKTSSIKRKNQEFRKRLDNLSQAQIDGLLEGDSILKRQIAYLSVCKLYDLIREFVVEVLREKMILMDYQLTEGEYLSFFRRKMIDHPELEELSDTTEKKVKQVVFRILAEAGVIDSVKNKVLQYQILEPQLIRLIKGDNPKWFEIFLLSDFEIANYSHQV